MVTSDMIEAMYDGQLVACAAVKPALPAINCRRNERYRPSSAAVAWFTSCWHLGRIAIQDGAELGPTYDWPSDRIVFVMAGGMQALVESVEGAEDNEAKGAEAIALADVHQHDVVIAVAAGYDAVHCRSPTFRRSEGAISIAVANNRGAPLFDQRAIVF